MGRVLDKKPVNDGVLYRTTSATRPNGVNSGIASTDLISTVINEVRLVINQTKNKSCSWHRFLPWGMTPFWSLAGTRCMNRWDEGSWDKISLDTEGSPS